MRNFLHLAKTFWDWLFEEVSIEAKIQPSVFMGKWLVTVDNKIVKICDSKVEAQQWAIANNLKVQNNENI